MRTIYGNRLDLARPASRPPEDKAVLSMWTDSGKTGQRLAKRAAIILLSYEGVPFSKSKVNL
jgi:hypothetical protein